MGSIFKLTAAAALLSLLGAACSSLEDSAEPQKLQIMAHDSFAAGVTGETFAAFTAETGIEVEVLAAGDAGTMVNQAVLAKGNPIADVLFGVDDTLLSRALDSEIFLPHKAAGLGDVDDDLEVEGHPVTPISFGDVCFNYDKAWFAKSKIVIPDELDDMRVDIYASRVTVEHPATSSPGLAFMLATIDVFGEDHWLDWWEEMRDAGINVVPDWDTAYLGDFTRYGGSSSIVLSYASSPPAEVLFSEEPLEEAPTGVIEAGCYRQVEYAGILEGTPFAESASKLIDFMLTPEFQSQIPLSWFVFPANSEVELPTEFVEHTVLPEDPTRMDPDRIAANRDRWIAQWVEVMEN